jgi:threonine dehydrogenase-like Zn-dependent dehydrogenase
MKAVGICGSDVHYWTHGAIGDFVVKGARGGSWHGEAALELTHSRAPCNALFAQLLW